MATIDLNADFAEGESLTTSDVELLRLVTSASLACGFHAGNQRVMRSAAAACVRAGVVIGAHVSFRSFRDRKGFGRDPVAADPSVVESDIAEQVSALAEAIGCEGATVSYLKPHGALYNQMGADAALAAAVARGTAQSGVPIIVAQARSEMVPAAKEAGLLLVPEGFPDRAYLPDGRLVPRDRPGALVDEPEVAGRRALSLATRGGVDSIDGTWTPVEAATLCVHGDSPGAAATARAVRSTLESAGVEVRAFVPAPRGSRDRPPE